MGNTLWDHWQCNRSVNGIEYPRLTSPKITLSYLMHIEVSNSLFIIGRLLESIFPGSKVIPLNGFHCTSQFNTLYHFSSTKINFIVYYLFWAFLLLKISEDRLSKINCLTAAMCWSDLWHSSVARGLQKSIQNPPPPRAIQVVLFSMSFITNPLIKL